MPLPPSLSFEAFDAVLLDLDGTLLRQDQPLPGAAELVGHLNRVQPRYAIITNSTAGPKRIDDRLRAAGVPVPPGRVWTAAQAACDYVVAKYRGKAKRPPRVLNLATEDVDEMLANRADLVEPGAACDAVIAGAPTNRGASDDRQRAALVALREGAELVGICADRVFPSRRGLEFGAGALCAKLAYAARVRPTYAGKPEARFFLEVCRRLRVDPRRCLLVGDNLEADVLGGKAVGMRTILITGEVTRPADVETLADELRPSAVAGSLLDLLG